MTKTVQKTQRPSAEQLRLAIACLDERAQFVKAEDAKEIDAYRAVASWLDEKLLRKAW